jgi:electron transport complex protein RnfE
MPHSFEPWVVMMLPPGGFFMIGVLLLIANWHDLRRIARERTEAPAVVPLRAPARTSSEPEVAVR